MRGLCSDYLPARSAPEMAGPSGRRRRRTMAMGALAEHYAPAIPRPGWWPWRDQE